MSPTCYRCDVLDAAAIAPETIRPISRAEYEHMARQGWFESERVELLYGAIVTMSPLGPLHNETVKRLNRLLVLAVGERADVFVQGSFAASDESEPEPDLAVVPAGNYSSAHPDRAFLLIEVADTSLAKDRGPKRALYAEAGVPEYWVVNLVEGVIEVYTAPANGEYQNMITYQPNGSIKVQELSDIEISVSDIL